MHSQMSQSGIDVDMVLVKLLSLEEISMFIYSASQLIDSTCSRMNRLGMMLLAVGLVMNNREPPGSSPQAWRNRLVFRMLLGKQVYVCVCMSVCV
jgi:hypothetical protein